MSEENECVGEFCAASILPTGEEKTEAETEEKKEEIPENAQLAQTLGIMTSVCQLSDEEEAQKQCWSLIEPLEQKSRTPRDTIKEYIEKFGKEELEKSIDAFKDLFSEVKKELVEEGKLPPEEEKEEVKE